jgi:hypothetical protein
MQINNLLLISLLGVSLQVSAAPIQPSSGESSGLVGYEVFASRQNNLGVPTDPNTLLRRDASDAPGTDKEAGTMDISYGSDGTQYVTFSDTPEGSQPAAEHPVGPAKDPAQQGPAPDVSEDAPAPGNSGTRTRTSPGQSSRIFGRLESGLGRLLSFSRELAQPIT